MRCPHLKIPEAVGLLESLREYEGGVYIDQLLPFVINNPYSVSLSIFARPKTDGKKAQPFRTQSNGCLFEALKT